MNTYKLKVVSKDDMYEKGQQAIDEAAPIICKGLEEVWQHCGGKLHRERCGWAGFDGSNYYIAER